MEAHVGALHAPLLAEFADLDQVDQALHVLFDHVQADELVQLREGLLQGGAGGFLGGLFLSAGGGGGVLSGVLRLSAAGDGEGGHGVSGDGLGGRAEEVVEDAPGAVPVDDLAELVHEVVELLPGVQPGGRVLREVLVRARGQRNGGNARFVTGVGELAVKEGDAAALGEGEGAVVGGGEHEEVLLDLGEGAAVGVAAGGVGLDHALEELRDADGVIGIVPIEGDGLLELLGGEFDLAVGVELVDAYDVAAPASAGGPEAEGAGAEVGVHLLGGDVPVRGEALAEVADALGVVPMEVFAHSFLQVP